MEQGLPEFLVLLPGIRRAQAHRLAQRFETFEGLAAASLEDLVAVEGMTPDLARVVRDAVAARAPAAPGTAPAGLYICPNCGSFVAVAADRCPHCGTVFEEGEGEEAPEARPEVAPVETKPEEVIPKGFLPDAPKRPEPQAPEPAPAPASPEPEPIPDEVRDALRGLGMDVEKARGIQARSKWDAGTGHEAKGLFLCSNCGGFVAADVKECPTCGAAIDVAVEAGAELRAALPAPDMPRVCFSCGAFNPPGSETCVTCGKGLYERYEVTPTPEEAIPKGFFHPDRPKREPAPGRPPVPEEVIPRGFLEPRRPEAPAEPPKAPEDAIPKGFLAPPKPAEPPAVPTPEPPADVLSRAFPIETKEVPAAPAKVEKPAREPEAVPPEPVPEAPSERPEGPAPEAPETPEAPAPEPAEAAPVVPPRPRRERGVTRDFARRWQRVAEARDVDPKAKLEEELEHYDELLRSNPNLERAWHRRAQILAELGRREEAIEAYDRLTTLNPAKDEEYRLEALDVTRPADVSPVPPDYAAAAPAEAADTGAMTRALEMYDRLVVIDPTLSAAWETRAEILRRLGRDEEAEASLAQARDVETRQRRLTAEGLVGLQTRSVLRAAAQTGRINGLVNGAGRTNGLVNGMGRTNGLAQVFTAADDETEGRINGLQAVPVLRGVTNGLVNGDGFVNGRYARGMPARATSTAWVRPAVSVAMAVAVFVLTPLAYAYLGEAGEYPGIHVDGLFSDWADVPSFTDAADTATAATDVLTYRVHRLGSELSAYVETREPLFSPRVDGVDSVLLFVDADGSPATGFTVRGIGAEALLQVWGYDGAIAGDGLYEWRGDAPDDFGGFTWVSGVEAMQTGTVLELKASVPNLAGFRATLVVTDNLAATDFVDAAVTADAPALVLSEAWTAPPVILAGTPVAHVDVTASQGAADIAWMRFALLGNVTESLVSFTLYADDGNGVFSPGDTPVSAATYPSGGTLEFTLSEAVEGARRYFVTLAFGPVEPTASVGLRLLGAGSAAAVSAADSGFGASYLLAVPPVTADGAFADWDAAAILPDADNDVATQGRPGVDQNIDLRGFGISAGSRVGLYFEVDGRVLGGTAVPFVRGRPATPPFTDADRDTVPDLYEAGLGDALPFDFNNNNLTDDFELGDLDGDGLLDYDRGGTDSWLNTTLPAWFGAAYAGKNISVYLGPFARERLEGIDTALAYLDADNSTATGLPSNFQGVDLGVDFVVEVRGRDQRVLDAGLFAFVPGAPEPFARVADVTAALDARRLEVTLPGGLANLTADSRAAFYLRNHERHFDNGYAPGTRSGRAPPAPANPAGTDVVINEISSRSNPKWIEVANPTNAARNLSGCVLQRRQGNNWNTIYTFTQTLGAFGSGTEYLAVNIASNQLPNGGALVRLQCGANEIDRTTYPAIGAGQSWARFKDPTTGRPMDSDSDAADFYVDATLTRGGANTRHRPTIAVAKTADVATSGPGGTIVYTVYYNNTDTGRANTVWVNDTLDSRVTFVSSSVPYSSSSGQDYRWVFTNVPPQSSNSFTITVSVGLAADGAVLVNTATLAYTDQLNVPRAPGSQAWANVTVVRPVISVVKMANVAQQVPGGLITYTILYTNSGSANANTVWINDTLPPQVTFQSSSVPPDSSSGQVYRWSFTNVAPGVHFFTITVMVNLNATWGDQVNWAFLNYTSQFDFPLEPSQDDAVVYIPEYDVAVAAVVLPLLLLGFRRWRRKAE